ncbi:MAG: energy-coupling factor ABC transporter permease [Candidatus Heimdallarchaeota archaeon]|nr:energy-coupling factor ABC transporter permease [Candidatus Heimdallarchaeota archaeon]
MRLPDGIVTPPIIIAGWIFSAIVLGYILKTTPKLDNKELTKTATVGAFIFVISSIPLPFIIPVLPVPLNLSGVVLALLLFGLRKGIMISSSSMILNHLLIAGSLGTLGVNISNMIILSIIVGFISHKMVELEISGRRIKYLIAFVTSFTYILLEGVLIIIEMALAHSTDENLWTEALIVLLTFVLLGTLEGFFVAISYSYYRRSKKSSLPEELYQNIPVRSPDYDSDFTLYDDDDDVDNEFEDNFDEELEE